MSELHLDEHMHLALVVSDVISTSGPPEMAIPHPASTVMLIESEIEATLRLLSKSPNVG